MIRQITVPPVGSSDTVTLPNQVRPFRLWAVNLSVSSGGVPTSRVVKLQITFGGVVEVIGLPSNPSFSNGTTRACCWARNCPNYSVTVGVVEPRFVMPLPELVLDSRFRVRVIYQGMQIGDTFGPVSFLLEDDREDD